MGMDASGCVGTNTVSVTINNSPTITVNSSSICSGSSTTLTASGCNSYTWSTGSNGNSFVFSPLATIIVTITGTDLNGCINTTTSTITVNATPSISLNSATICAGQAASLTASGANSYTWNTGSTNNTIVVSPASSTSYSVIGSSFGCTSSSFGSVTVNALPTINVNQATVCSGSAVSLIASGASTYSWSNGSNTSSISVSPTANVTYTIFGGINNCVSAITTSITVNPLPILSTTGATICAGNSTSLSVSGANTYTWSNASNSNIVSVTPSITTIYTVSGTSTLGCTATLTSAVNVNPNALKIPIVNNKFNINAIFATHPPVLK
jgi:hypothetical protein